MQHPPPHPVIVMLVALSAAALLSQAVTRLLCRFSGWSLLAERYPLRGPAPAPIVRMGYGAFRGWLGYNGCLIISVDDAGFYLSGWPVFLAPTHRPIQIPWGEVLEFRLQRTLFARSYQLVTRGAPEVDFSLNERTFGLIRDRIPSTIPIRDE